MKQDINLLPRKEKGSSNKTIGPILLVLLLFAALLYAGIVIPQNIYHEIENKNNVLEDKVTNTQHVSLEYDIVMLELKALKKRIATVEETHSTQKSAYDMLYVLQNACPINIKIENISFTDSSITIKGIAPNDASVAQFMVELKRSYEFGLTNISAVSPSAENFADEFITRFNSEGIIKERDFILYLTYPIIIEEEESQ